MPSFLRTSIAARSAAIILALVGLIGAGFFLVAIPLTERQESARQQERLNGLLDTVQRTVSIACFLSDRQLADEVAQGLLANRTVGAVTVSAGGVRLAHRANPAAGGAANALPATPAAGILVRQVMSPFNPAEVVGEISLVPDADEIRSIVRQDTRWIALLLAVQLVVIGLSLVAVVVHLVVRPISRISARLHELRAEHGQKLAVPQGNETDEIGQLVHDVNAMVDKLVAILNQERTLRLQREIDERKFRAIFDNANTGIFLVDASGRLNSWNPAFAHFFALAEVAPPAGPWPAFADLLGAQRLLAADLLARCVEHDRSVGREFKLEAGAGMPTRWINVVLSPVEDGRLQGVANDVTEQKRAEESAQQLAASDPLTGLGNRLGFERRLEQLVDRCYRDPAQRFALLMLDLDWFKQVNDTYGHPAGDEVLVQVARRIEKAVRQSDYVARVGGDEFAVLLDAAPRRDIIERVIGKIIAGIGAPIAVGAGLSAIVGASVGAAVFSGVTQSKADLIRRADEAMYRAKKDGRNRFCFDEDRPIVAVPAMNPA
jgi:diguanylate cyclase (GGDEF)-like protein